MSGLDFYSFFDHGRPFTHEESAFIFKILGVSTDGFNIVVKTANTTNRVSGSMPTGMIIFDNSNVPTMAASRNKGTMVHEFFHQYQYKERPIRASLGLIGEAIRNKFLGPIFEGKADQGYRFGDYTHADALLNVCQTLDDLPNYESRAQLVGQFAELYDTFTSKGVSRMNDRKKNALKQQARILHNSDFRSEAIDHIGKTTW